MRYLVDANVLSEPTKPNPDMGVVDWLGGHMRDLAVDPVIIGEVRFGILLLPKGRRRDRLEHWFDTGVTKLRCLPWESHHGLRWAELLSRLRRAGTAMPVKDSLIAASALVHGLIVVTRNTADFAPAGVEIFNPFED